LQFSKRDNHAVLDREGLMRFHSIYRLALGALALAPVISPAQTQDCISQMARPYICSVEIGLLDSGGRWTRHSVDSKLKLPAGGSLELTVIGIDQYGRRFPNERAGFKLEPARDCSGLLSVRELDEAQYSIEAGGRRDSCSLWLWVPGNLNLEWPITVEVTSTGARGYTRNQAQYIAERLYLAILDRPGEPAGVSAATAEIQRGQLGSQIRSMVRSPEFKRNRASLPAVERLEDIYQGLLGRNPDSAAVRRYLREIEKGNHRSVIREIVRSEEFESKMLAEASGGPSRLRK
jgi:hypothetical protein